MVITKEYFKQIRQRHYELRQKFQEQSRIPILDTKNIILPAFKTYIQQEEPIYNLLNRIGDELFQFWLDGYVQNTQTIDMVEQLENLATRLIISQELKVLLQELWLVDQLLFSCAAGKHKNIADTVTLHCNQQGDKPWFLTNRFAIYGWYYAWQYVTTKNLCDLEKFTIYLYLAKLESRQDQHYMNYFHIQQQSVHKTAGCMSLSMWLQSAVIAYITNNIPLVETGKIIISTDVKLDLFHSVLDEYLHKAAKYGAFKGRYKASNGKYQYYITAKKFYDMNKRTRKLKNNSKHPYIDPKNKVYLELLRDINRNLDIGLKIIKVDDKLVVAQSVSAESVYHRGKNFK